MLLVRCAGRKYRRSELCFWLRCLQSVSGCAGGGDESAEITRILQCSLNKSVLARNLLQQRVYEDKTDTCIISEQHTNVQNKAWFSDNSGTAAIWVSNPSGVMVESSDHGEAYVWMKIPETYIVSVYLSPNKEITVFQQKLAGIEDAIIRLNSEVIIAVDFNAKSTE